MASDSLISAPLFLGWFIDDIQIQTANFATIATVGSSIFEFDVMNRPSGTYFYRIAGLFGDPCTEVGPYSNIRQSPEKAPVYCASGMKGPPLPLASTMPKSKSSSMSSKDSIPLLRLKGF